MNQLTPIQEMAAKDLFIVRLFGTDTWQPLFRRINSRYRWDTIRPLVELGYARM